MATQLSDYKAHPRTLEVAPGHALTIEAERGTELRVLEGLVWLTQEGHYEDYIVAPGMRFCSGDRGSLVASAVGVTSRAVVSWTDPQRAGGYARSGVWFDYGRIERLEAEARCLRAATLRQGLAPTIDRLVRAWRALAVSLPPASSRRTALERSAQKR